MRVNQAFPRVLIPYKAFYCNKVKDVWRLRRNAAAAGKHR